MRAVIQRVKKASVSIHGELFSSIDSGMLVLVGIEEHDTIADASWLSKKLLSLRIFDDEAGVMNYSVIDVKGEMLIVSQFTLHALTKRGNRPSYIRAARPEHAIPLFEEFIRQLSIESGISIQTGKFGAMMEVSLINDGPVTILMDTKNKE